MARKKAKDDNGQKSPIQSALWGIGLVFSYLASFVLFIFCISLILFLFGCEKCPDTKIVYRCPKGQVEVTEDRGLPSEAKRCYTPGVSYTDFRALTTHVKES